jgi:CubicO group peptidase (beta-lactamase class C family)
MDMATQEQAISGAQRHGLGWMLKSREDSSAGEYFSSEAYGHTGFTGTSLWIDPERELVVATMTNRVYPGREKVGIHGFRRALHDLIAQGIDS